MNLDFILFAGPKAKYNFVELWGEVIFIPSFKSLTEKQLSSKQQREGIRNISKENKERKKFLSPLGACYCSSSGGVLPSEFQFEKTISDTQDINNSLSHEIQSMAEQKNKSFNDEISIKQTGSFNIGHNENSDEIFENRVLTKQKINHYIPCLYLNSLVKSKYLFLSFHSAGQDIKIARHFFDFLRNSYQVNVIAMEYRGYSIYRQHSSSSSGIKQDAKVVYQFITNTLGFKQENIIIIGRSIGSGVALDLLKSKKINSNKQISPRAVVLISAFASIKHIIKDKIGKLASLLAQQTFNNYENIAQIKSSLFLLHGKKDGLIPWQQSQQLFKNCYTRKILYTPNQMTHSNFDYYTDLIDPLRQFLMNQGVNFYEKNMKGPAVPDYLFEYPLDFSY